MATTILESTTRTAAGRVKPTTTTVNVTHNSRRLYTHTDGETYMYVGNDASGNRMYRNTRKLRG